METKTILRLEGEGEARRYSSHAVISLSISVLLFCIGLFTIYAFFHNGQAAERLRGNRFYKGPDGYTYSVLFLGVIVLIIAYIVGCYFLKSFSLCKKSCNTKLEVTNDNIYGVANGIKFEIALYDVVYVESKYFSVKTHPSGMPVELRTNLMMKFLSKTSRYLVIQTKNGDIYYIDALPSLEHAESVIRAAMTSCARG